MEAYKIYFGNRTVILTGKITKSFENSHGLWYKFSSKEELAEILNAFEEFTRITSLHILADDPEKVLEVIKSLFTVLEAAGGIVKRHDGRFLGIFRNGVWDLPKGKAEEGESSCQTALREVEEECGLKSLEIGAHLLDTYHTYRLKGKRILKRTYWYEMRLRENETPVLQTEEGITDYKWFDAGNVEQALNNTYESLREAFKMGIQLNS
jgi:8-oxo-dGTP pyrophosphatase MutT (NUDIX family)